MQDILAGQRPSRAIPPFQSIDEYTQSEGLDACKFMPIFLSKICIPLPPPLIRRLAFVLVRGYAAILQFVDKGIFPAQYLGLRYCVYVSEIKQYMHMSRKMLSISRSVGAQPPSDEAGCQLCLHDKMSVAKQVRHRYR